MLIHVTVGWRIPSKEKRTKHLGDQDFKMAKCILEPGEQKLCTRLFFFIIIIIIIIDKNKRTEKTTQNKRNKTKEKRT